MLVHLSSVCARIETLANGQPNSMISTPSGEASSEEYIKTLEILVSRIEVYFLYFLLFISLFIIVPSFPS